MTQSHDFPTTPGALQTTLAGPWDGFISKLNAAGSSLVYSTYFGGNSVEQPVGIAVDAAGNAFVTGRTDSADFPVTPSAFQSRLPGVGHGFVMKLNAGGTAAHYSTYLGGSIGEYAVGIAIDAAGNAYITGDPSRPISRLRPAHSR